MYDIVEGLHKALRIESTWVFVLVIAIGAGVVAGFFAWVIDTGYKNSLEHKEAHQIPVLPVQSMPHPTATPKPEREPTAQKEHSRPQSSRSTPVLPQIAPALKTPEPIQPIATQPSTVPSAPRPILSGSSPYQELRRAESGVDVLNTLCQQSTTEIIGGWRENFFRLMPRGTASVPLPSIIPDDVIQKLADRDEDITESYLRLNLQQLHARAIAYMTNMTPNERELDEAQFESADRQARKHTPLATLQSGRIDENRMQAMHIYLTAVVQKLGDYP